MILELKEKNFVDAIKKGKWLVMFKRSQGCSFCAQMLPVFHELEGDFEKALYELGPAPDSITKGLVERFPTFVAFVDGVIIAKQEGVLSHEELRNTFSPEKIKSKQAEVLPISKASMAQLLTDEAALIDQIGPMRSHLAKIQKEIEKRKKLAMGKVDCCDSCADGGECDGGCE